MCAECATLRAVLESTQASEAALLQQVDALQAQSLRTALAERSARAELTKHREDSPHAKAIREVLDYWLKALGKTKATKTPMTGDRAAKVAARLKEGYTVERCKRAVDGMAALPCTGPKGRAPAGQGERFDDITICLQSGSNLERFEGYAQKAAETRAAAAEQERLARLWAPVDRVLLELRNLGSEYRNRPMWFGELEDRPMWAYEADCPLCPATVRIGETHETRYATVECAAGCDWWRLLDALHLWPSDLTMPSDPEVTWAPLIEDWPAPVAPLRVLPPLGSPVLFEEAA